MMVRLAALALQAHKLQSVCNGDGVLAFGAGLSDPDEPDVLLRDFTGQIRLWIEVGQPDEKALIKACGKADEVVLYCFGHAAEIWWRGIENRLTRPRNLHIYRMPTAARSSSARWPSAACSCRRRPGRRADAGRRPAQRHVEPITWK
jgi:uncharacterized protein YaeQ